MGDVRPEYVFLGFLAESPAHGYQLYQQFKKDLSGLWHISEKYYIDGYTYGFFTLRFFLYF